jgi:hypothetical protein
MNSTRNKRNGKNGNRRTKRQTKRQPKLKKKTKKTTLKKREKIKGGVNPRRVGRAVTRNNVAYQPPYVFVDNLPVRRKKCDNGFRFNKVTKVCDPKLVIPNSNINQISNQNDNQDNNYDDNQYNNSDDNQNNNDLNRRAQNVRQLDEERERQLNEERERKRNNRPNNRAIAPNPEVVPDQDMIENANNLLGMKERRDSNNPNIGRNNEASIENANFLLRMNERRDSNNPSIGRNNELNDVSIDTLIKIRSNENVSDDSDRFLIDGIDDILEIIDNKVEDKYDSFFMALAQLFNGNGDIVNEIKEMFNKYHEKKYPNINYIVENTILENVLNASKWFHCDIICIKYNDDKYYSIYHYDYGDKKNTFYLKYDEESKHFNAMKIKSKKRIVRLKITGHSPDLKDLDVTVFTVVWSDDTTVTNESWNDLYFVVNPITKLLILVTYLNTLNMNSDGVADALKRTKDHEVVEIIDHKILNFHTNV